MTVFKKALLMAVVEEFDMTETDFQEENSIWIDPLLARGYTLVTNR